VELLMRALEFIAELKIDNKKGLGAVPHNADVHYFGLRTVMRPSTFLKLSLPLDKNSPDERETINHLKKQINDQGFGAPFLTIAVPPEWEDEDFSMEAKVRDHDGRHRMYAIQEENNDAPVETHIFIPHFRRRDITEPMIKQLRNGVLSQNGHFIGGPLFGDAE
jgi:hypothetical protein